jgi:lysozyme
MTRQQKISALVFASLLLFVYLANRFYFSKRPIMYANFGIEIPAGYSTHGIDVSHYQHDIDWKLASKMVDRGQKISFAIVKATEGTSQKDSKFDDNWSTLDDHDILRGAYLYLHPNQSGKKQAQYFISKVDLEKGDLPPVIDIEETKNQSSATIQKCVKECADALEAKFGVKPIIYSNVDFYKRQLGKDFDEYPLWAAHYEQSRQPRIDRDWLIWQHSCKGRVNGIDAEVDFNVVNGSIFALHDICIK